MPAMMRLFIRLMKRMHFAQGLKNNVPLRIFLLLNKGTKEKPEFWKPERIKGNFRDDTAL